MKLSRLDCIIKLQKKGIKIPRIDVTDTALERVLQFVAENVFNLATEDGDTIQVCRLRLDTTNTGALLQHGRHVGALGALKEKDWTVRHDTMAKTVELFVAHS